MGYTEEEIQKEFCERNKPYQKESINYNGKTTDTKKPYIEVLAELIDKKEAMGVEPYKKDIVKQDFCYSDKTRYALPKRVKEKNFCAEIFNNKKFGENSITEKLGTPCEIELNIVPGTKVNVDLLSFNKQTNSLYLIEVKGYKAKTEEKKKESTKETILRAALEIKTYYETLKDLFKNIKDTCADYNKTGMKEAEVMKMAILVPKGSKAAEQYEDKKTYPLTNKLIEKWGIEVFTY